MTSRQRLVLMVIYLIYIIAINISFYKLVLELDMFDVEQNSNDLQLIEQLVPKKTSLPTAQVKKDDLAIESRLKKVQNFNVE